MERHDKANIAALHICITNAPKMNFKELGCDDVELNESGSGLLLTVALTNTSMKLNFQLRIGKF